MLWVSAKLIRSALIFAALLGLTGAARPAEDAPLRHVAVLPFRDLDGTPDTAALGDEIADDVTSALNEQDGLAVLPPNIVSRQSEVEGGGGDVARLPDALALAKKLGVDTLVIGSYKRVGATLQVDGEVVVVSAGSQPDDKKFSLAQEYPKGYVSLLREAPEKVAALLRAGPASSSRPKPAVGTEVSASFEAHQLYAQGLQQSQEGTREGLSAATDSFHRALEKDPNDAQAYAAKASVETELSRLQDKAGGGSSEAKQQAVTDAMNAVKRAPYYGEAHWQLSRALTEAGDFEDAEVAARVAALLWPANPGVFLDWGRARAKGKIADDPEVRQALRMTPALAVVVPELPQVTVVNEGDAALELKFAREGGEIAATLQLAPHESRIVGLLSNRYTVTSTGGGETKTETRDFGPGSVYSLDGQSLAAKVLTPQRASTAPNPIANKPDSKGPGQNTPEPPKGPVVRLNPKTNAEMIFIPGGEFQMGEESQADNKPHRVYLSPYWIGKTPVTVHEFRAFTNAPDGYAKVFSVPFDWEANKPPFGWREDDPMVNVTWFEARAYCKWAGGDLTTEAQWEHAARGLENRIWPWGDQWDAARLQWSSTGKAGSAGSTMPVRSHPEGASPYGCLDMAGNVAQWCRDGYQADLTDRLRDPVGVGSGMVLRGGSWVQSNPAAFRSSYRIAKDERTGKPYSPQFREPTIGFRFAGPDSY